MNQMTIVLRTLGYIHLLHGPLLVAFPFLHRSYVGDLCFLNYYFILVYLYCFFYRECPITYMDKWNENPDYIPGTNPDHFPEMIAVMNHWTATAATSEEATAATSSATTAATSASASATSTVETQASPLAINQWSSIFFMTTTTGYVYSLLYVIYRLNMPYQLLLVPFSSSIFYLGFPDKYISHDFLVYQEIVKAVMLVSICLTTNVILIVLQK
jgi:hypothetical protein